MVIYEYQCGVYWRTVSEIDVTYVWIHFPIRSKRAFVVGDGNKRYEISKDSIPEDVLKGFDEIMSDPFFEIDLKRFMNGR